MVRKKTNLSVAADVETVEQMLELAEKARQKGDGRASCAFACCTPHGWRGDALLHSGLCMLLCSTLLCFPARACIIASVARAG